MCITAQMTRPRFQNHPTLMPTLSSLHYITMLEENVNLCIFENILANNHPKCRTTTKSCKQLPKIVYNHPKLDTTIQSCIQPSKVAYNHPRLHTIIKKLHTIVLGCIKPFKVAYNNPTIYRNMNYPKLHAYTYSHMKWHTTF